MIIWLIILAVLVAADQLTKYLTVSNLAPGESADLIKGVFRFTYIRNEGAAFGILSEHRWVFLILSTAAIAGIVFFVLKYRPKSRLVMTSLTLIAAGGIGNMIDRVRLGYVIDFLDFCAFPKLWMWIFNVADSCVVIGSGLLFLYLILDLIKTNRENKNSSGSADPSGDGKGSDIVPVTDDTAQQVPDTDGEDADRRDQDSEGSETHSGGGSREEDPGSEEKPGSDPAD